MNSYNNLKKIDALIHERIYSIPLHAVTDEDFACAVFSGFRSNEPSSKNNTSKQSYIWNGTKYDVECVGSKCNYGGNTGNDGYGLWFWHNRFNSYYQEDIEIHVKNWKRPVPKYSSDISLAMAAAEKVHLFSTIMLEKTEGGDSWQTVIRHNFHLEPFSAGLTAAEAIARGCLVLKAQKDEQAGKHDQFNLSGVS